MNRRILNFVVAAAILAAACLLVALGSFAGRAASRPARAATVAAARQPAGRRLPANARVQFDLVLRLRQGAANAYAKGLFDPSSPLYGHYLTSAQFGRRFGVGEPALEALEDQLRRLGITLLRSYPQETLMHVSATAATIERVFGVTLRRYGRSAAESYLKPSGTPVVPHQLASGVASVSGLNTDIEVATDSLPGNGLLQPVDIRTAYDMAPLQSSDAGNGDTIAVLSIGAVSLSDYAHYAEYMNQEQGLPLGPAPKVDVLSPLAPQNAHDVGEGDLDLQVIHSIVPNAQIIDYEIGDRGQDFADAINQIADTGTTIVSASFGDCDGYTPRLGDVLPKGYRSGVANALMAAALRGTTFYFATGDTGAYACQQFDPHDTTLSVQFPADDPYTVAVGGTDLSLNSDGTYQSETAWGDSASDGGGGGGINPYDAAPPWQVAAKIEGIGPGHSHRETPDVSAAGGDASPYMVYQPSARGNDQGWTETWGTSEAAPIWSASMLLVQEAVEHAGAGPICFAAPLIYAIATRSWSAPPFHDVTSGNNRRFLAIPGWDAATGWGSPDLANLATDIESYRSSNPLPNGSSACTAAVS